MYEAKIYEVIFTVPASYTVHVCSALLCVSSHFKFGLGHVLKCITQESWGVQFSLFSNIFGNYSFRQKLKSGP